MTRTVDVAFEHACEPVLIIWTLRPLEEAGLPT
jgi:hypothetical protein